MNIHAIVGPPTPTVAMAVSAQKSNRTKGTGHQVPTLHNNNNNNNNREKLNGNGCWLLPSGDIVVVVIKYLAGFVLMITLSCRRNEVESVSEQYLISDDSDAYCWCITICQHEVVKAQNN